MLLPALVLCDKRWQMNKFCEQIDDIIEPNWCEIDELEQKK
jgi:hypothetical protein